MRTHVVYRSTGPENAKARPHFYSKAVALCSLLRSVEAHGGDVEITFLNDGPMPEDRLAVMRRWGALREVADIPLRLSPRTLEHTTSGSVGLTRSYLAALELPRLEGWGEDDLVYFVEDDYLHDLPAVACLADAAEHIPGAAYFATFAYIDWSESIPLAGARTAWFLGSSVTSTYAARIGALEADRWIHLLGFFAGGTADRTICEAYAGKRPFLWNRVIGDLLGWAPDGSGSAAGRVKRAGLQTVLNALAMRRGFARHVIAASVPLLALHMESTQFAESEGGQDLGRWEQVAAETRDWARERGIALRARPSSGESQGKRAWR